MSGLIDFGKVRSLPDAALFWATTFSASLLLVLIVLVPLIVYGIISDDAAVIFGSLAMAFIAAFLTYRVCQQKGGAPKKVWLKAGGSWLGVAFMGPIFGFAIAAAHTLDEPVGGNGERGEEGEEGSPFVPQSVQASHPSGPEATEPHPIPPAR